MFTEDRIGLCAGECSQTSVGEILLVGRGIDMKSGTRSAADHPILGTRLDLQERQAGGQLMVIT